MNRRDFIGAVATALPLLPSLMPKREWRVAERIGDTMYGTDVETGCVVELRDVRRWLRVGDRNWSINCDDVVQSVANGVLEDGSVVDSVGRMSRNFRSADVVGFSDGYGSEICSIDVK